MPIKLLAMLRVIVCLSFFVTFYSIFMPSKMNLDHLFFLQSAFNIAKDAK
jgi:hypothetical protein